MHYYRSKVPIQASSTANRAVVIVGHGRSNEHGTTATGVVDTGTGNSGTAAKVTWADVVRKSTVYEAPRVKSRGFVSRSFSRNNPVNRTEV